MIDLLVWEQTAELLLRNVTIRPDDMRLFVRLFVLGEGLPAEVAFADVTENFVLGAAEVDAGVFEAWGFLGGGEGGLGGFVGRGEGWVGLGG
jgi:hypothetical protein